MTAKMISDDADCTMGCWEDGNRVDWMRVGATVVVVVVVGLVWLRSPPRVQANHNLKLSLLYCCNIRSLIGGMKPP